MLCNILMKRLVFAIIAMHSAFAAFANDAMPLVTAEGRLAGAYQDNVDAVFICLVLEKDGSFNYAFIRTNDTASVLKELQSAIGRQVTISGFEKTPDPLNRAVTKRQIMIPSIADVKVAASKGGGIVQRYAQFSFQEHHERQVHTESRTLRADSHYKRVPAGTRDGRNGRKMVSSGR